MIKCDRCKGMDAPHCVESCPTHALTLVDPEEIAQGKWGVPKKGKLIGLNFVSPKGLAKAI
jgi:Fe-S-cluster-containing hydrogenase component 2